MPFRITPDDKRAAKVPANGSMDGARAVCEAISAAKPLITAESIERARGICKTAAEGHNRKHNGIDNFYALAYAHAAYQEIAGDAAADDQGVHEQPDEAYMAATFAGMHEAVTRKCGEMPIGCWRCERETSRPFAGAIWIRHERDKHYLVFTDASGNSTEYRIYFCPWCGKKF